MNLVRSLTLIQVLAVALLLSGFRFVPINNAKSWYITPGGNVAICFRHSSLNLLAMYTYEVNKPGYTWSLQDEGPGVNRGVWFNIDGGWPSMEVWNR